MGQPPSIGRPARATSVRPRCGSPTDEAPFACWTPSKLTGCRASRLNAMSAIAAAPSSRRVLADVIARPTSRGRAFALDAGLVVAGAALVAVLAQVSIPLWPVPITGQTLGVIVVGAALGSRRGAAAMITYMLVGLAGLPVFADFTGTIAAVAKPSFGFVIGFIFSAFVAGWFAEREWDRRPALAFLGFAIASLMPFLFGLPYLAFILNVVMGLDLTFVRDPRSRSVPLHRRRNHQGRARGPHHPRRVGPRPQGRRQQEVTPAAGPARSASGFGRRVGLVRVSEPQTRHEREQRRAARRSRTPPGIRHPSPPSAVKASPIAAIDGRGADRVRDRQRGRVEPLVLRRRVRERQHREPRVHQAHAAARERPSRDRARRATGGRWR